MATPDILITPHRNDPSYNPRIDFTGTSTGTIHLEVLSDGAISFIGNNGTLFNIQDNSSGSLINVDGFLNVDGSIRSNNLTLIKLPINSSDAVNKWYVDSSFALKSDVDASLSDVTNIFVANTSLGNDFYWNAGLLEVSSALSTLIDVSLDVLYNNDYLYYDSSWGVWKNISPTSASDYFYTKDEIDANFLSEASLGNDFVWSEGLLEVSVGAPTYSRTIYSYIATADQSTFSGLTYTVGLLDVFYNGVRLNSSEYIATTGTSVILSTGAESGALLDMIAFSAGGLAYGFTGTFLSDGSTVTVKNGLIMSVV